MKTATRRKHVGNVGESVAGEFLSSKGHRILMRNYQKPWGEIDIITRKAGIIHFVEVKSISRENIANVSQPTSDIYRAEENMHPQKIARLQRTIQTYIAEHSVEEDWQLDLVAVTMFIKDKKAECLLIENVL